MRPMIGLAAIAFCAPLFLSASTAVAADTPAARNYDCSKAGNANKAACKGVAAAPAKPAAAPMAAKPAAKPTTAAAARNYDCSKPGNANKAACKTAAAPAPKPTPMAAAKPAAKPAARPAPMAAARPANGNPRVVEWTTKTGKVVHYDCSKAGNLNKTACK